jgi:copper chaperone
MNERLFVANMKCSGCAHSIKTKLGEINGIDSVAVELENDAIDIGYDSLATRHTIIQKLHDMGYPEATEENGLLLQLKSYANCMVGRMTK